MRLKQIRLDKMMSQEDLSKATGLTEATISRLEHGTHGPKLGTIRKLMQGLGVTRAELMRDPDPEEVEVGTS